VLVVALAGCASNPVAVAAHQDDPHWLLLESPVTSDYPEGAVFEPIERWPRITEYASLDKCRASMWDAQNQLQRPVTCVASDDPRIMRK